jgi:predicted MFS family arabinose efflux permease
MSLLVMASMFTAYTYVAYTLARIGHFGKTVVGWTLMGFGAAGAIGNNMAGHFLDRGPMKTSVVSILVVCIAMAISAKTMSNFATVAAALALWGAAPSACFVANQVRVIKAGPTGREDLAACFNVSVFNTGIGFGAIIGGKVIDVAGLQFVGLVAAAVAVCAIALGLLVGRSELSARTESVKEHA